MEKPILYCDCDGVIFNTIETAFQIMERKGCDMSNPNEIDYYFRRIIDWREVFANSKIINNAIDKIRLLKDSDLFSDVIILTKLSGNYYEEGLKRDIFRECLPDVKVITLQYGLTKALVVNPKGNVLIDDELRNCNNWKNYDGIAVLFDLEANDLENDIVNDLLDIPNTIGVKKLFKTSKF